MPEMSLLIKARMKKYWKGIDELVEAGRQSSEQDISHDEPLQIKLVQGNSSRRDFLKTFGFVIAGSAIASSCKRPVTKAIPYLIKPEEVSPGKANYYASTFFDGELYQSVLVKVRDGRPIKLEGNDMSSLSNGSTSGLIQGSVLELYDVNRYRSPMEGGVETTWESVDQSIREKLASATGKVVLLSGGIISPSTRKAIAEFTGQSGSFQHIVYDPVSVSALREANRLAFGRDQIPDYRFDRAGVILGLGADFLGTWISPVEYTQRYAAGRKPTKDEPVMSRHIQIESGMSLTGSNADERISIKPSQQKAVLVQLLAALMSEAGEYPGEVGLYVSPVDVSGIAQELWAHRGKALVVCGSNDVESQLLVNGINWLLGSYGNTIDFSRALSAIRGVDRQMESLVDEMNSGDISGVIFYNCNPVYDYYAKERFVSGLEKLEFSVSLAYTPDETSVRCDYVCPDHHYLESWNDAMPKEGLYSLCQPAIRNIFTTRQAQESLLRWSGNETPFYDYIRTYWEENLLPLSPGGGDFRTFWNQSLHDGIFELPAMETPLNAMDLAPVKAIMTRAPENTGGEVELDLYVPISVGSGKHANNPWLQEIPDPVSRVTWDNYAAISPRFAEDNGLAQEDVIRINGSLDLPVVVQPGQHYGTISVALGYGKEVGGKAAKGTGGNAYHLVRLENGTRQYHGSVTFEKTGSVHPLACTQTHHSMEGRALIRETTLEEYREDPASGNELHAEIEEHLESLYKDHPHEGHHWGMTVDLNSCTGCSACVVACIAENNVPVVGKEQVKRRREMHWIRIDRYYSGDPENPEVSRQPVMCQQCDHAPCENVCPVAATTHSHEGLNMMIYNRCIGTRYCNNNCPYKVRRFNWLDFTKADAIPANTYDPEDMTLDLSRMVLNPDVTVRAKGVMEKCSFCVQRIQEKKLQAKLENRPLAEGDIKTACQQVCPAQAITFGDLNNEEHRVTSDIRNPRNYHLLEELDTLPTVSYLTNIRNKKHQA